MREGHTLEEYIQSKSYTEMSQPKKEAFTLNTAAQVLQVTNLSTIPGV